MGVIRLDALYGLERAITCAVPELKDKVCVGQSGSEHNLAFPSLSIDVFRWKYEPNQAQERYTPSEGLLVVQVGNHRADVQLRVGAATKYERALLEQKILNIFLSSELAPGVLITHPTQCEDLGPFFCSWTLEDDQWGDEKAFDAEYYSEMTVEATIPALVTRSGVYTVFDLQVGVKAETAEIEEAATMASPGFELITVQADGTITGE